MSLERHLKIEPVNRDLSPRHSAAPSGRWTHTLSCYGIRATCPSHGNRPPSIRHHRVNECQPPNLPLMATTPRAAWARSRPGGPDVCEAVARRRSCGTRPCEGEARVRRPRRRNDVRDIFSGISTDARTPSVGNKKGRIMKQAVTLFVGMFTTLLAIINPLEALPVFLNLLQGKDEKERLLVARRSCVYAMLLMFFFLL